jgi:hypothetical protein
MRTTALGLSGARTSSTRSDILAAVDRTPYARAAARVCAAWGLTDADAEALVRGDAERAHIIIGIHGLLTDVYSGALASQWMTIPNYNPAVGGTPERPVRPVDHAIDSEGGLEDVWTLLRGYAEGK